MVKKHLLNELKIQECEEYWQMKDIKITDIKQNQWENYFLVLMKLEYVWVGTGEDRARQRSLLEEFKYSLDC